MTSRERVLAALNHAEPDRVPFDFGGTIVSGIHVKAYRLLREHLGLPWIEPRVLDIATGIAVVDDDVRDHFGVDVTEVSPRLERVVSTEDMGRYIGFFDQFGIGWRMPKVDGLYYDMFFHPLGGSISMSDVESFPWPGVGERGLYSPLKAKAQRAAIQEERAVVVGGVQFDGPMQVLNWLRGFEDGFADLISQPKLACKIMDHVVELKLAAWEQILDVVDGNIDVAAEWEDLGSQVSTLISPRTYRNLVKPRHKLILDYIRSRSDAKIFFHSDGAIRELIPDLIEIGVDILNPVQVSASGMDSAELKREFGRDLVFWGGGIDTQHVLGAGTPEQVREEVKRRVTDLMPGGGFVFSAVHNIQADVPPENIVAMWEALREWGGYG